jgi:hypothetical protein
LGKNIFKIIISPLDASRGEMTHLKSGPILKYDEKFLILFLLDK